MRIIDRLRQQYWPTIFIIYLRYLIGGAFVFSSIIKIQGHRFTTDSGADYPINSAWHLFETLYQSGLYWSFLGWSQLIAGALLMTQRFAALGAVMFSHYDQYFFHNYFLLFRSYSTHYSTSVIS